MKPFKDLGIQNKINLMTLVICGAVLLVAIVALFSFQVWNFRTDFVRNDTTLAKIIGDNCNGELEFGDTNSAQTTLNTIKSDPAVISARITTSNGSVFVACGKSEDEASLAQFASLQNTRFVRGQLLVSHVIRGDKSNDLLGTIYVRSDYRHSLMDLLKFYGQMLAMVVVISICLCLFLSRRLSRTITLPVLKLARTAKIVGEQKDYSVRVSGELCGDELGRLTDSFNEMLGRIQSQDAALSRSQEKMQALINSIDGIVWERNPENFQFTFVSRQSDSILGYKPVDWLDNSEFWAGKLHPQDAAKAVETAKNFISQAKSYSQEYRMIAADGRTVWMHESGTVLVENGKAVAVRGILQDITRQKNDAAELDKLNRKLLDTSRAAGMADVATGVLHNVGNVLNSVSVATTVVGERLQRSKVTNLQRATAMLLEQNGRLGDYLTSDPKGKLLPTYFDTVAGQLAEERDDLITKVQSVAQNIEHIKEIVAMQQSYARVSGAFENLTAAELVEDALRINMVAFDRHNIKVVRQFTPNLPPVCVDRHKVLQILINLLRNAKHAMEIVPEERKQMVISINPAASDQIAIVVRDYGIGIPTANLTKIFNHGFTTKKDGHGFGLHSGANAAREMGGSLTAHSEGPDKGAELTLKLPIANSAPKNQPVESLKS